jgi:Cu/Ag efflux protein CusF
MRSRFVFAALAAAGASSFAFAQAPKPVQESDVVTVTATIEAIDQAHRRVTLKGEKGRVVTVNVPPEVERFSSMKVGDVVTARYIESVAVRLVQPGETAPPDAALDLGVTKRPGEKPGATIANKIDVKVKVQAIDKATPALTVETPSGNSLSFKVKDPKRLEKLKVGDEINVTYTEALLLTVDPKKP